MRPGTVRRSLLIERLVHGGAYPIVSVVAPPGYGKTTLLSQWAESNGQPFAWVSIDELDNPGQFGAWLGCPEVGSGVLVDDPAGRPGPG